MLIVTLAMAQVSFGVQFTQSWFAHAPMRSRVTLGIRTFGTKLCPIDEKAKSFTAKAVELGTLSSGVRA